MRRQIRFTQSEMLYLEDACRLYMEDSIKNSSSLLTSAHKAEYNKVLDKLKKMPIEDRVK